MSKTFKIAIIFGLILACALPAGAGMKHTRSNSVIPGGININGPVSAQEGSFETLIEGVAVMADDGKTKIFFKPASDTNTARGTALTSAISGASSGDTVVVGPGIYDTRLSLKNGVDLHFQKGAVLIYSVNGEPLIYDTSAVAVNISGYGVFWHHGSSGNSDVIKLTYASTLYIEGRSIISDNDRCIVTGDSNGGGSVITANFDLYQSKDGTFDNVDEGSIMRLHGNRAISNHYVLENDGGEIHCWIKYIESTGTNPVERASDGTIYIYGTYVKSPDGYSAMINTAGAYQLWLYGAVIECGRNDDAVDGSYMGYYARGGTTGSIDDDHAFEGDVIIDGSLTATGEYFRFRPDSEDGLIIGDYNYKIGDMDNGENQVYLEIDSEFQYTKLYNSGLIFSSGYKIDIDSIRALSASGLGLYDDGGSGIFVEDGGNVGVGTGSPTAILDINGDTLRLRTSRTPSSATDTGNQGDIAWDSSYIYICIDTNTWKRTAISTW